MPTPVDREEVQRLGGAAGAAATDAPVSAPLRHRDADRGRATFAGTGDRGSDVEAAGLA